ncbi:MAG: hypothetical protein IJ730_00155 [Alphaproteobacteria bacterium]|nr:hypothetical protein [Alphaproteobacteria bacterium]
MRKHEVEMCIISVIIIVVLLLCFVKREEVRELNEEKNSLIQTKSEISELVRTISRSSFNFSMKREQFSDKHTDIRRILIDIAKKTHVEKIKLKKEFERYTSVGEFELKFTTKREKYIYNFIDLLRAELNLVFDSIKIIKKDKNLFFTKIKCRYFQYYDLDKGININPIQKQKLFFNKLQLFQKDEENKKHFLRGIINCSKAYIDDKWKNIGDTIDDYTLKGISDDSIIMKNDDEELKIKLGGSW